jgi:hypothetical protein
MWVRVSVSSEQGTAFGTETVARIAERLRADGITVEAPGEGRLSFRVRSGDVSPLGPFRYVDRGEFTLAAGSGGATVACLRVGVLRWLVTVAIGSVLLGIVGLALPELRAAVMPFVVLTAFAWMAAATMVEARVRLGSWLRRALAGPLQTGRERS